MTDAGMGDAGVVACTSSANQPDTCGYGKVCNSANTCDPVTEGTCENITKASAADHAPWTASSTGPVIFNVVDEATDVAADCASDNAFTATVWAYQGTTALPATKSALPGFYYYKSTGAKIDVVSSYLKESNYTQYAGGAMMSAKFTLCSSNTSALDVAFGFANGNGYCVTLHR
jgi:hypothetical protein